MVGVNQKGGRSLAPAIAHAVKIAIGWKKEETV
jgi:hypothetical protein